MSNQAPTKPATDTAALIERWWAESMHGSILAQNTECYNHVRAAVDRLKKLLSPS